MFLALLLLVVLVGWLVALRLGARSGLSWPAAPWATPQGTRRAWWVAGLLALAAHWPVYRHLPLLLRSDAILLSDAASHAAVIRALAEHGVPHGWIDVYDGGFPLAVNYPPLGWLLGAALVRLGLPVPTAIQILGLLPYVLAPVAVVLIARAAGARPIAGLAGALALAWIAPYNAWLGTYETYLGLGLLSQSMAVPFILGTAWITVGGRGSWGLPVLGAGLASAHPQISVMAVLFVLPFLALGTSRVRRCLLLAVAGCGVMGIALYGPGLAHHHLPFAWTNLGDASWVSGYKPDRIVRWTADAELFDQHRVLPVVTTMWLLSIASLAGFVRQRVPRLALVAMGWAIGLSMVGRTLLSLGDFGDWVLSFLQPQRAFSLVPLAMSAVVVVAVEELGARGDVLRVSSALRGRGGILVPTLVGAGLAIAAFLSPRVHVDRLASMSRELVARLEGRGDCPSMVEARAWVGGLRRGRLSTIEDRVFTRGCPKVLGVELRSAVPMGLSAGAGAHVGMMTLAYGLLRPTKTGIADRAEATGVRWLIHKEADRPVEGFRVVRSSPPFELSERLEGTDLVGIGCVEQVWRGDNRALRVEISRDMHRAGEVLHPRRLVAIEETTGDVVKEPIARDGCDPAGAIVVEHPREPGAQEATVVSPHPVDVVVRSSAFTTWRIEVDGEAHPWRTVAPGFMSVRVPAGEHRVIATAAWPPLYGLGVGAAGAIVAVVVALAWRRSRRENGGDPAVIMSPR